MTRYERKQMIREICNNLVYYLQEEEPDIEIDVIYTAPKLVSRYIAINLSKDRTFVVRVSDHPGNKQRKYDYSLEIENGEFKLCSSVMDILRAIKEQEANLES